MSLGGLNTDLGGEYLSNQRENAMLNRMIHQQAVTIGKQTERIKKLEFDLGTATALLMIIQNDSKDCLGNKTIEQIDKFLNTK